MKTKVSYPAIESDDGQRAQVGVVASLRDVGGGESRLVLDDVFGSHGDTGTWKHRAVYTWRQFDSKRLDEMALAAEDYQRIGEALVARLLAANGRVK